jgi:hypothetical protein
MFKKFIEDLTIDDLLVALIVLPIMAIKMAYLLVSHGGDTQKMSESKHF